jgi:hypothetical protein
MISQLVFLSQQTIPYANARSNEEKDGQTGDYPCLACKIRANRRIPVDFIGLFDVSFADNKKRVMS